MSCSRARSPKPEGSRTLPEPESEPVIHRYKGLSSNDYRPRASKHIEAFALKIRPFGDVQKHFLFALELPLMRLLSTVCRRAFTISICLPGPPCEFSKRNCHCNHCGGSKDYVKSSYVVVTDEKRARFIMLSFSVSKIFM